MLYFIERWTRAGWTRVSTGIANKDVAENLKASLAARYGESEDNFSILVVA